MKNIIIKKISKEISKNVFTEPQVIYILVLIRKILKEHGLKIEDALIVHDDSDIYMGDYKISRDRGAAGHKGVEHIMAVFGTKDFTRLRIGIRPKQKTGTERKKADEFVLKKITAANMKVLEKVFEEATSRLSS